MQWKVVIIGSGNVAAVLGRKIKNAGHNIIQVAGRNEAAVKTLAGELGALYDIGFDNIHKGADLYIIAVADDALANIDTWLPIREPLVTHTAGSVPADVLQNTGKHYGILYPLQSLRSDRLSIPEIPFLVDGNDDHARDQLINFAHTLSNRVQIADDATRTRLHIAAVVANNFANHLFALAKDFCTNEGIDFSMLQPLMEETVQRLEQFHPGNMQTGPAVRGDEGVIRKHLDIVRQYPDLYEIYRQMTKSIQNRYHPEQK